MGQGYQGGCQAAGDNCLPRVAWRKAEEENGTARTKFVPHASTWLNQKRFLDYKIEAVNYAKCDDIAAKSGYKWVGTETDGKYVKLGREENGDTGIHDI